MIEALEVQQLRAALTGWFETAQRTLPWRSEPTPYRVWVSEIMLQQTQVAAVIPYFERWMERFPTPTELANAPLDDVLAVWAGLGYYSRARNLHKAAIEIRDTCEGEVPSEHAQLLKLPGVGRYTAGAVASIAFGQRAPLVDGNVTRVLCRVFGLDGDTTRGPVAKTLWKLAAVLVPEEAPGDFNQGLMELGALLCRPKQPKCDQCPWRTGCVAHRDGRTGELPTPKKRPVKHRIIAAGLVVQHNNHLLMVQRSQDGLLGGLWAFPSLDLVHKKRHPRSAEDTAGLLSEETRTQIQQWAQDALNLRVERLRPLRAVDHIFTHIDYTLIPWHCAVADRQAVELRVPNGATKIAWVERSQLGELGLPRMIVKALATF